MKVNGNISVMEGGKIINLTLPSGPAFPANENNAELFILTADTMDYKRGLYAYDGTLNKWRMKADMDTVIALIDAHVNNADVHVSPWPQVKNKVATTETLVVKDDYQLIVQNTLTVEGTLDINGEVYIK